MTEGIESTKPIIPSAAHKLIRKYPTIYGRGLDEGAIEGVRNGTLIAEVVFYGDGTRGLQVREANAAQKKSKPAKKQEEAKIDIQPLDEDDAVEEAVNTADDQEGETPES